MDRLERDDRRDGDLARARRRLGRGRTSHRDRDVDTLLRRRGGISASWTRRVLHDFADDAAKTFPEAMASRLLTRAGEGEDRVFLFVDNHLRPYTGQHVVRKGWRMQDRRPVPGTTDYYVHDEEGCPLWRMSTTSHDSLCAWLMPVVEFAKLSLGDDVTPVLVFDRGGAYPETMAELRDAGAEFVTYERKPYPQVGRPSSRSRSPSRSRASHGGRSASRTPRPGRRTSAPDAAGSAASRVPAARTTSGGPARTGAESVRGSELPASGDVRPISPAPPAAPPARRAAAGR
jgi:hypothetical protein